MKITKFEHACLLIEDLGQYLVIDPGMFAESLPTTLKNVSAIVITHQHGDHLDQEKLLALINHNPDATIFAPRDVIESLESMNVKKEIAEPGVSHTAGSFALDFYGTDHAIIH